MAKTKTKTPKAKKGLAPSKFNAGERVLYYLPEWGKHILAQIKRGAHISLDERGVNNWYYTVLLAEDKYEREVAEHELTHEPLPKFKRGDLVKPVNPKSVLDGNGTVVRITPKKDIGYVCHVFWNSSGSVSNFDEVTLQLYESEK